MGTNGKLDHDSWPLIFPKETSLYIEMAELSGKSGFGEWQEVARWVKYEELVEEGGQRWSKPYVPTVELKALQELRTILGNSSVIRLNFQADSVDKLCRTLCEMWANQGLIHGNERSEVLQSLLRPHTHLHEIEDGGCFPNGMRIFQKFSKKEEKAVKPLTPIPVRRSSLRRSSVCSVVYLEEEEVKETKKNAQFLRKIPVGTESVNIMVAKMGFLEKPVGAFLKLREPHSLGDFSAVDCPTRFIFFLLTPSNMDHFEMGRAVGALLTDPEFRHVAYTASNEEKLLHGIDQFMEKACLLPPVHWDKGHRLDPPQHKKSDHGHEDHDSDDSPLARTGILFGGLIKDIRRKAPWYISDFTDALSLQCLATWLFLYFACLTPAITFGGLMGLATNGAMATMETMMSCAICGIGFALFAGQPLLILGATGPVLVFEKILVHFSESHDWNFLEFRLWVGIWLSLILLLLVAFEASALVAFVTRFTEENFATLISFIFIIEAFKNVALIGSTDGNGAVSINDTRNGTTWTQINDTRNGTTWNLDFQVGLDKLNTTTNVTTEILPQQIENQSTILASVILFAATFFIASLLKDFRASSFFPTWVRFMVSDFAVVLAIAAVTGMDMYFAFPTPKLEVPETFAPTSDSRGWFIPPFGHNPVYSIFIALFPALFASVLIFMDQQITAVIVNRKDHKLKKGFGYHLDLFVLAVLTLLCSFFGLPWLCAATVRCLTNVNSLKMESESAAPGEKPTFLGVREQRVTNILVSATIGVSVLMTGLLRLVPMPVLYGVFLYMGWSSLKGMVLFQRILLFFMPPKYQPDHIFLRQVPLRRVHVFTFIQVLCLVLLWIMKSIKVTSILFPLMLVVMVAVRMLLQYFFTETELVALDDPLPGQWGKKGQKGILKR